AASVKQQKMRELGRAALQCYGIIIEPLGDRFAKRVPAFLAAVDSALSVSLKTWKQAEAQLNAGQQAAAGDLEKIAANLHSGGNPQDKALAYWETAYMALNTFGRYVSASPQRAMGEAGGSRIWLLAVRHLTHPHAWVRLAAARLIGLYVANADPSWMLEAEAEAQQNEDAAVVEEWEVPVHSGSPRFVLMSVQRLRDLVHGLMVQLNSRFLSAELGNQVVKNLYFVARCFLTAVPVDEVTEAVEAVEKEDADSDNESDADATSDVEEEEIEAAEDEDDGFKRLPKERCLIWLINRVGRLARTEIIRGRGTIEKRTYSFRWFAAIIALVPPALLRQSAYMMPMASPLYRTSEDTSQAPSYPVTLPNGTI
ncbi:U3 snoRNP protein, partial [Coemansia aciculifera]